MSSTIGARFIGIDGDVIAGVVGVVEIVGAAGRVHRLRGAGQVTLAADGLGILREAVAQDEVDGVAVEVDEAVRQVHDEAQLRVALEAAVMHFFF